MMNDVLQSMKAFSLPHVLTGLPALDSAFGELRETKGTYVGTLNLFVYKLTDQLKEIKDIIWSSIKKNNREVFLIEPEERFDEKQTGVYYYSKYKNLINLIKDDFSEIVEKQAKESVFIFRLSLESHASIDFLTLNKLEVALYNFRQKLVLENKTVFFILGNHGIYLRTKGFTEHSDTETHFQLININNIKTDEVCSGLKMVVYKNRGGRYGQTIYTTT